MNDIEEKVIMLEELLLSLVAKMKVMESDVPEYLDAFLKHYNNSLAKIYEQIEISNKRYDDQKIQQNIDAVTNLVGTMPKVLIMKNHHYFGAWSKSFIISIVISFFLVASSVGYSFHLNDKNNKLRDEAYYFWLIRALYPNKAKEIVKMHRENPKDTKALAEKEMEKQNAVIAVRTAKEKQ